MSISNLQRYFLFLSVTICAMNNLLIAQVSKDFVLEYEKKEKENQERLTAQVERHISTLKNLRVKLEDRNDLKNRSEEYRSWQRDFLPKKNAVMLGRTIEQAEKEEAAKRNAPIRFDDEETDEFNSFFKSLRCKIASAARN